ncbi:L10-interacting MYB domain-containing protein-like [Bidens hawaiensis]|uniref:L10-interacting MYB domain-containing protein-like n=1 Tax=Bidens hawaiensis TaxID=980011 RepID=UPI00404A7ED8
MEKLARKNKTKFLWSNDTFKEFIDACLLELKKGYRSGTHFTRAGWENIVKTMHEKTGVILDNKQIKNNWDVMKIEWKLYDCLMRIEIGICGTRSSIDASPEWWDEKIKMILFQELRASIKLIQARVSRSFKVHLRKV